MTQRLKDRYRKEIIQSLMTKLNYKNINAVPKIKKIVLNMGLGQDGLDKKKMEVCIKDMSSITGQYPVITKFKKSISNFKTRKGSNAGVKVTLISLKMYEFIDRLVNIALPRIKDFRGLSAKGIDNSNNYSFGIKEHIIFPEVNFDKVDKIRGLDIMNLIWVVFGSSPLAITLFTRSDVVTIPTCSSFSFTNKQLTLFWSIAFAVSSTVAWAAILNAGLDMKSFITSIDLPSLL